MFECKGEREKSRLSSPRADKLGKQEMDVAI